MGIRRSNNPDGGATPDALAVLEKKHAQGEIDREEYFQKREDLKRG